MKQDFIFDIETIGQNVMVCPIIDIAWTTFEWDRFVNDPYSFEELTSMIVVNKLDVKSQMDDGCSFTKEDLKWWQSQSKEAQANLKPREDDLTMDEFCANIFAYLREQGKIEYWWSRGNTFDPVLIERIMHKTGQHQLFNQYLPWWRVRDMRTYIDAKFDFKTKNGFVPVADTDYWDSAFVGHDSRHDVAADILRLQAITRAEHDLEQVER
jgi:hypothetical protein